MDAQDLSEIIAEFRTEIIADLVNRHLPPKPTPSNGTSKA